jgi:hypothetical protein
LDVGSLNPVAAKAKTRAVKKVNLLDNMAG